MCLSVPLPCSYVFNGRWIGTRCESVKESSCLWMWWNFTAPGGKVSFMFSSFPFFFFFNFQTSWHCAFFTLVNVEHQNSYPSEIWPFMALCSFFFCFFGCPKKMKLREEGGFRLIKVFSQKKKEDISHFQTCWHFAWNSSISSYSMILCFQCVLDWWKYFFFFFFFLSSSSLGEIDMQ